MRTNALSYHLALNIETNDVFILSFLVMCYVLNAFGYFEALDKHFKPTTRLFKFGFSNSAE